MKTFLTSLCVFYSTCFAADYGPPVGTPMPPFQAQDQNGRTLALKDILGPKGALIVFFRSADWWPFCKAQLVELEHNRPQFEKLGVGVAAISYDSVAILHNFAQRRGIHFPLLSDPQSSIIRSVGLLNESIPKGNAFFGIPYPGTFVLDSQGIIKAKYFEEDYKERYTAADILTHQYGVEPSADKHTVEGKQLTAVTSASNFVVRGGQRVALVIDIDLKPRMHVYAPGVTEGYIPIDWKMTQTPLFAAHDTTYPPSKTLHLAAIDETVPVFEGHFRLVRDITIGAEPKVKPVTDASNQFTVTGILRYQACDDRKCYVPQELPLTWTFQLEGHDRERAPADLQRKAGL